MKFALVLTFLLVSSIVKGQVDETVPVNAQKVEEVKKPFNPQDLDIFIEELLKCRNIPSAIVSLVQLNDNDDVVLEYTKGYGRIDPACDSNNCDNVDENSRYCIGSVSKSFTAGVLGKLLLDSKFK